MIRALALPLLLAAALGIALAGCGESTHPPTAKRAAPSPPSSRPSAVDSARALARATEFEKATAAFHRLAARGRAAGAWNQVVDALTGLGEVAWRSGALDSADVRLARAIDVGNRHLPPSHPALARAHLHRGIALDIRGAAEPALEAFDTAQSLFAASVGESDPDVAFLHHNRGIWYEQHGDYPAAERAYRRAIRVYRQTGGEGGEAIAKTYSNLGVILYRLNDLGGALQHWHQSLRILISTYGPDHPVVATVRGNIGSAYSDLARYDDALAHFEPALRTLRTLGGPADRRIANIVQNMGVVYDRQERYDDARAAHEEALAIRRSLYDGPHPDIANSLHNLAVLHHDQSQSRTALRLLRQSLAMFRAVWGERHPDVAEAHRTIGRILYEQGDVEAAVQSLIRAVVANRAPATEAGANRARATGRAAPVRELLAAGSSSSLQRLEPFSHPTLVLTWMHLADALAATATPGDGRSPLRAAVTAYELAVAAAEDLRRRYVSERSTIYLAEETAGMYARALRAAMRLHRRTGDRRDLRAAFRFGEKGKAASLVDARSDTRSQHGAALPDSLADRERTLRREIRFYEQRLAGARQGAGPADSASVARWEDRLVARRSEHADLQALFERAYPAYLSLRYAVETAGLDDLQQALRGRPEPASLLSYTVGPDSVYAVAITADSARIRPVAATRTVTEQVATFRQAIMDRTYAEYVASGRALYESLVAPIAGGAPTDRWVVIPDGILHAVSFEALLTAPPSPPAGAADSIRDYRMLPYLLLDRTISYAYSATLFLGPHRGDRPAADREFLALAPVFAGGWQANARTDTLFRQIRAHDPAWAVRTGSGALPASRQEVRAIANRFEERLSWWDRLVGDAVRVYVDDDAQEQVLKSKEAARYRFVHLATHGLTSESAPALSRLLLAPADPSSEEDGTLHLGEVYGLSLNAELVVLSACETGLGRLVSGEGVIGLTRGFLFAGAENLVVSLWQAPDAPTRDLMVRFYDELLSGTPRGRALHAAKRSLLRSSPRQADPFVWAPFILIGSEDG